MRERVQNRAAQQSAARPGPDADPAQRRGSRWFMYDILRGGGNLPGDARAAGLTVALSTPLGCAEYIERSSARATNGSAKRRVLI